ncbi:MAG: MBL fold metallo-hydrolase [Verrucomicrobiota bacterium]|nr:MBL fold metallo-hydrolase [Verrucomicrobiota bacterium]
MAPEVHILDTRQSGRSGITAATAVETGEGLALFDCGAESTFTDVTAELRGLGSSPRDVRHVFLSHIHLDHAGSAWRFAELGANVYVHPRGAAHLIDPSKLIESATRIFGADMERLWGGIGSVPEDRIRVANDGDTFPLGAMTVRVFETPGHANHHNVYQWDDNIFGGDVAGVRLGGGPPIPPFVPPELHIERWLASIEKIRSLAPARIYLPHFGLVAGEVNSYLDALAARVSSWSQWFREAIRAGRGESELIKDFAAHEAGELKAAGLPDEAAGDYECADPSFMAVTASLRYWQKYHPELLGAS